MPREFEIEWRRVIDKEVRLLGLAEDHRLGPSGRYPHRLGESPPDWSRREGLQVADAKSG